MSVSLCIHGHFYQPPREDPWLGSLPCEASAAPTRHWNERILRESYAPLAHARRLDSEGRIADILNCYEWMSFNAGPTLLQWMRRNAPETLECMKEGDANSIARWGRGNALAQVYHHSIMPLASPEDRALEIRWAIDDFRHHFSRDPEGMWLAECAVDTPTLESLADQNIAFVVLSPRQAKAVLGQTAPAPGNEERFNIGRPYRVALPSGRFITAIFYHDGLSQAIAFEGLLRDGEHFWQRITEEARRLDTIGTTDTAGTAGAAGVGPGAPLLTLATDGETYGHHFMFGEMALAHVLAQGYTGRDGIRLTNLAAHIAANPPQSEVVLHEFSSWSCVHGVERWRSDCGCTNGGHPGWNQRWRGPLRDALEHTRAAVRAHFSGVGAACFTDPQSALLEYGTVLADPGQADSFAHKWLVHDPELRDKGWKLLVMQELSLASFASCAWFFDDIGRIEPENALSFALRSMDLLQQTGGPDPLPGMLDILASATSNQPDIGNGRDLFEKNILPRRVDVAILCLLAWLRIAAEQGTPVPGVEYDAEWPCARVEFCPSEDGPGKTQSGKARIRIGFEHRGTAYFWRILPLSITAAPDTSFTVLSDTTLTARPMSGDTILDKTARVGDLGKPLRDTLLTVFLEERERKSRPARLADAAHALSLTDRWHEAQHDLILPEYWFPILPYLPAASMRGAGLSAESRERLRGILERHLSGYGKRLAQDVVREVMLAALPDSAPPPGAGPHTDDAALAHAAREACQLLPDMDWWDVQNRLWALGPASFPALASELGFR